MTVVGFSSKILPSDINTIRNRVKAPSDYILGISKSKANGQTHRIQSIYFRKDLSKDHQSKRRTLSSSSTCLQLSTSSIATSVKALHSNPTYVLTAILWLSSFGTSLERRTTVGKALSAPLATMALALTIANLGVIPFRSPIYSMVNLFFVPLAVPLLLFDSDLRRVISDTGILLAAFGVGAIATIVGTLLAYPLVPLKSLGPDVGWRVACALAARHIGGAINFVAVAETLHIGGNAVAAASK